MNIERDSDALVLSGKLFHSFLGTLKREGIYHVGLRWPGKYQVYVASKAVTAATWNGIFLNIIRYLIVDAFIGEELVGCVVGPSYCQITLSTLQDTECIFYHNFLIGSSAWHFCGERNTEKLGAPNKRIRRFIFADYLSSYDGLLTIVKLYVHLYAISAFKTSSYYLLYIYKGLYEN